MSRGHPESQFSDDSGRVVRGEWRLPPFAVLENIGQGRADDQMHDDKGPTALDADIVDRANVPMEDRGCDPRLAQKGTLLFGRHPRVVGQLDRDEAVENRIVGAMDDAE